MNQVPNILVAATGSVATVKLPELVVKLREYGNVSVVLTKAAVCFTDEVAANYNAAMHAQYQELLSEGKVSVFQDSDEWDNYRAVGLDPVVHIELMKWAHVCIVAPLSANTLAKISNGLADNLLTCIMRAWDASSKPLLVAPAMNTNMWKHPLTAPQLEVLRKLNIKIIHPVSKQLACGDTGVGALAMVDDIVQAVAAELPDCDWKQHSPTLAFLVADGKYEASIKALLHRRELPRSPDSFVLMVDVASKLVLGCASLFREGDRGVAVSHFSVLHSRQASHARLFLRHLEARGDGLPVTSLRLDEHFRLGCDSGLVLQLQRHTVP